MNNINLKINKKVLKKIILSLIGTSLALMVFCIYTDFYYEKISINTLEIHFIICINIVLSFISKILNGLVTSIINKENIKVIIIVMSIVFISCKFNLRTLLDEIYSVEFQGFKMQLDPKKALETINKQEEKKAKQLKDASTSNKNDEKVEAELEITTKKMNLIKIFSDDPFLLNILNRFINKKQFCVSIPFYVLKEKTTITSIGKIFDYKITSNTVKVMKIREDIKDLVYDLYFEIQNKEVEKGNK